MKRIENPHHARFLTFSCYQMLPLFANDAIKDVFVEKLRMTRERHAFLLHAWVVMPDHVHMVIRCHAVSSVPSVMRTLKTGVARGVIDRWKRVRAPIVEKITAPDGLHRFWQRGGGYDRNILQGSELPEKIRYIHANPVRRGLVSRPEEWVWSSARWWAGERDGEVVCDQV